MIKEDVRMKKWAPRVLLAAALAGLSAFLLKGDGHSGLGGCWHF